MKNETGPRYVIVLSLSFLAAFIALRHIFHELHEFGHMTAGRLLCGAWGGRDFNNVAPIPDGCGATPTINLLVAMAGPMVNYVGVWIGAALIWTARAPRRAAWGLALIFACLPFARVFTALIGGGDEMGVARSYIANPALARAVCIALVCSALAFPLYAAYRALGERHRLWYFLGFLIAPMLLEGAVILLFFNYVLKQGVLNETWLLGAPGLVILVLLAAIAAFALFAKHIPTLAHDDEVAAG